jgi:hypothetical protein
VTDVAVKHPAKFSAPILEAIGAILDGRYRQEVTKILDPFAGVGGIHALRDRGYTTKGLELEPEWADQHAGTEVGNILHMPEDWVGAFDAVVTSPCYGNRMADHHDARDGSRRITYKHYLGRDLTGGSSAAMQWGVAYRRFHETAWLETIRVIRPNGLLIVNCKNHYRDDKLQLVNEWHLNTLIVLGCQVEMVVPVDVTGHLEGENWDKRVPFELVMIVRTPATYRARLL